MGLEGPDVYVAERKGFSQGVLCYVRHHTDCGQRKTLLAVLDWFRCRGSLILEAWVSPPVCLPVESCFVDIRGRVAK